MEKQLTSEELNQVKNLQEQTQQVTMQLGAVEIKKMQLKDLIQNLLKRVSTQLFLKLQLQHHLFLAWYRLYLEEIYTVKHRS
mgnify:CR=1 FL=1